MANGRSSENLNVQISVKTILITIGILLGLQLVYNIRAILIQLFVAIILTSALNPVVNRLEHYHIRGHKISRISAIILTYVSLFIILMGFGTYLAQPLTEQTRSLINQIPYILNFLNIWGINEQLVMQQFSQVGAISANIFRFLGSIFSNVFTVFTTVVMSFYLLLEREHLHRHLGNFFSNPKLEKRIERFINRLEIQMGGWVRAQVILMIMVGVLNYLGFALLGIDYALALAIIAGFLEIIPNIGPTIAIIPAAVAGFSISTTYGIAIIAWSIVVQQVENNILVPQVMSKSAGINPLLTIIGLLIGLSLAGIPGAILAVPAIIIIKATVQEFFSDMIPGTHPVPPTPPTTPPPSSTTA